MRYAQLVMGPAGSGKTTYCNVIQEHGQTTGRVIDVVNLDPAAEEIKYPVLADVRELVQLEDVMEADDLRLGPNGGLVFCMEYIMENLEWMQESLGDNDEDYIVFDCPGQIELYTHLTLMRKFVDALQQWDFRVCGVFLIDAQFLVDPAKYFSGVLAALSAMVQLEIPHINVMSKMDLLNKHALQQIERYLDPDALTIAEEMEDRVHPKYRNLNRAIAGVIDDYSLVRFLPLNIHEEDSVIYIMSHIDHTLQYGEDQDPKEPKNSDDEDFPDET